MKAIDFKKEVDRIIELLERFNEIDDTKVIITKSNDGIPLVLFMRNQEVLDYFKVEK